MRSKTRTSCRAFLLALALLALAGCTHREASSISPVPAGPGGDTGLGPGVRPLSSGPGDKSSPSFSPSGDRMAFVIDGYVVDKPVGAGEIRQQTRKDFGAEKVEWTLQDNLMILGADAPSSRAGEGDILRSIYLALPGEDDASVTQVIDEAQAMSQLPDDVGQIAANRTSSSMSGLVRFEADGTSSYPDLVDGRITGISASPDGRRAVFAVRVSETPASFELYTFRFSNEEIQLVARLEEGAAIFGAPQWTQHGIYFVAGEKDAPGSDLAGEASPSNLYRVTANPDSGNESTPEPAAGVGADFVASSARGSPDGERLAIIGRRNPGSQTNLYVLDLSSGELETLTENENMEIKTGPNDLSWSEDGRSVVIVARATVSGPEVRAAPAETLLAEFYNLYGVPVDQELAEDVSR